MNDEQMFQNQIRILSSATCDQFFARSIKIETGGLML